MSSTSASWWKEVETEANRSYHLEASIIDRLDIKPLKEDNNKYQRVRSKVTTLLLDAINGELSEELTSNKELHPTEILFYSLKLYQPGGVEERSTILRKLEEVPECQDAQEGLKELKIWERRKARAEQLDLVAPDR